MLRDVSEYAVEIQPLAPPQQMGGKQCGLNASSKSASKCSCIARYTVLFTGFRRVSLSSDLFQQPAKNLTCVPLLFFAL